MVGNKIKQMEQKLVNHTEELRIDTVEKWKTFKVLRSMWLRIILHLFVWGHEVAYQIRHHRIKSSKVCSMNLMDLMNLMQ